MELVLVVLVAAALVAVALAAWALPARIAGAARAALGDRLDALERGSERVERLLREELARSRAEASAAAGQLREELRAGARDASDATARAAAELRRLADGNEARLEALRGVVDARLRELQQDNGQRLEEVRRTVDEKLQGALERRLGESFRLVSERLEAVQRGLGEMQALASGVGDLRKVLANVKVRGTWGEIQLGSLLEQVLAPEQLAVNVATRRGSAERVEFAIRLPGRGVGEGEAEVLLPIDAKFPVEDYQRLVEASERGDAAAVEASSRALEQRVRASARDVHDKYLNPPATTDFALMFLPTEGLYAEVVRRPGLVESLQRDWRVVVAGPTTLTALLNSLQMGFRTLAIQRRSSEVWSVLGAVKAEFGRFGEVLGKVERKLQEASTSLQAVGVRSRAIERRLRDVEELPAAEPEAPRLEAAARPVPDELPA